jgi:uncharacterized protein YoxC
MGLKLALRKKQKMRDVQACTTVEEAAVSIQDTVQEEPHLILQKLMNEETNLMDEKQKLYAQLADLREKRRLKLQRKIRRKKNRIKKLRTEIKDLKFSCQELSKSLRYAHTVGTK